MEIGAPNIWDQGLGQCMESRLELSGHGRDVRYIAPPVY